jgi:hypothetical protein
VRRIKCGASWQDGRNKNSQQDYGIECHRNEIQKRPKNRWEDEVLNDIKKLELKTWIYLVKNRKVWYDVAQKTRIHNCNVSRRRLARSGMCQETKLLERLKGREGKIRVISEAVWSNDCVVDCHRRNSKVSEKQHRRKKKTGNVRTM